MFINIIACIMRAVIFGAILGLVRFAGYRFLTKDEEPTRLNLAVQAITIASCGLYGCYTVGLYSTSALGALEGGKPIICATIAFAIAFLAAVTMTLVRIYFACIFSGMSFEKGLAEMKVSL